MSRSVGRLAYGLGLLFALLGCASAQNAFPTPQGSAADGTVIMCPSAANAALYVPCSATNPGPFSGVGAATIADGADVAQGTTTDVACATDNGNCTELALLKRANQRLTTIIAGQASELAAIQASIPAGTNTIGTTGSLPYPVGAIPYTATATGTTGATTATLAGAASVTTYICGFSIRANATAAATGNATVTGVITATLNFTQWTAPNASGLGVTEMIFSPCVPASAANTSVAVVSAAPGTGGVVSVTAWGFKL